MIGTIVDQKRLDRLKEQPRWIAETRRLGTAVAQAPSKFREDQFGAGWGGALQHSALELGDQQCPRSGLELPEVDSQLFGGSFGLVGHFGTIHAMTQRVDIRRGLRLR
jgi:hypothetical protein